MRENLKKCRTQRNMTQKQVSEYLGISERYYKQIEYGDRVGSFSIWDNLEELFATSQRKLREISENHHDKEDSQ